MAPRILLTRPDHLGDVLLTLPAVSALRRAAPEARITYVVQSALRDVPARAADIDEVIDLPFPPPDAPPLADGWDEAVRLNAPRFKGRFDAAVLLRPNDPWSGRLVAAAEVPVRVGYPQPGTRPFLTHTVPERPVHCVDLALSLLRVAGATFQRGVGAPAAPDLEPTRVEEIDVERLVAQLLPGDRRRPIVLHPGSGWSVKNWPEERWAELASELRGRWGTPPLAVGPSAEEPLLRRVASRGDAVAISGLRFGQLVALHRRAAMVVSTDNGAMHLAALLGIPVVGIYGPGDHRLSGPWGAPQRIRVVRTGIPCSPCREFASPPCGVSVRPQCVMGIDVAAVLGAADDLRPVVARRATVAS